MAKRSSLNGEVRELKIGQSFAKGVGQSPFHTIRYDFKPASVDKTRDGTLQVDEGNTVSITVPHSHGNGQTNFGGRVKSSNPKECILIIDHETGEITLERLSTQIMVKKTRQEKQLGDGNLSPAGSSFGSLPQATHQSVAPMARQSRPLTPIERLKQTNGKPVVKATNPSDLYRSNSPLNQPSANMADVDMPMAAAPHKRKPTPSMQLPTPSLNPPPANQHTSVPQGAAAVLSDSSSSSSSSSDDSSSSDGDSDNEAAQPPKAPSTANHLSMPSFGALAPMSTTPPHSSMPTIATARPLVNRPNVPSRPIAPPQVPQQQQRPVQAMSMPQFLTDDLKLSESDDSD